MLKKLPNALNVRLNDYATTEQRLIAILVLAVEKSNVFVNCFFHLPDSPHRDFRPIAHARIRRRRLIGTSLQ